MKTLKPLQTIRWRLALAFGVGALFISLFVGIAINAHIDEVELAAKLEASHVAELMADTVVDEHGIKPHLQAYVSRLFLDDKRDFVIVDSHQIGLADAHPEEVGLRFDNDLKDEVGQTIFDGRLRYFVEAGAKGAAGAQQIVVPIRRGTATIGAVILEYTPIRDELYAAGRNQLYLIVGSGAVAVFLVIFFGYGVARRIARPLAELKDSAVRLAAQDYAARVAVTSHDEIGIVGAAFNKMAEELGAGHAELIAFNTQLDQKVSERTKDLNDSAIASLNMMEDAIREREDAEQSREKLDYLAYFDPLTGFANQTLLLERIQAKLLVARGKNGRIAVLAFDIQRFKSVNDAFGWKAGDELLKLIAERLVEVSGDATRYARIGADRFAIVTSEAVDLEQVGRFVEQRLDATFRAPFRVGDNELRVSVKMGIAMFPDDGADAETLLRNAEAALKKAKGSGDRYVFFTEAMTARVAERLSLENRLRQALDNEEFVLHYQPKVNLASGLLTSAEALIRWNDPKTGLVPPLQFIPILEETGLIHDVGRWAMRKAIEDHLRWRNAGLTAVRIAVNVSPLQLRNRNFVAEVEQALAIDPQAAAGLELEITESLIMEDVKHSTALLLAIRAMGVTIAIDDFGTGYSSLSYLSKLPVDTLKIDRSFVNDMGSGPDGLALVSTILALAHSLKLKVVAEGVETEEQSRLLRLLKCDEMQGYLFSKPVPAELFEAKFLLRIANAA